MLRRVVASHRRRADRLRLERLEDRVTPAVYDPTHIKAAYGFDKVAQVNGTTLTGHNQTIAIVDAYYSPYAVGDLATFDTQFGLPAPPSFQQVSQTGGSPTGIAQDSGWGGETALDIEWAHAIAPGANILLVEAASASSTNLFAAVAYARSVAGVSVVSMSWGTGEFSSETGSPYTADLSTQSGHTGVSFVASSGDNGAGAIFPATSPRVLAIGGTTLNLNGGNYTETAWSGSGGGPSAYFSRPTYQNGVYSGSQRGTPDVSFDADPNTGVYVYNTYDGGLEVVGGTSAGAPQWAGLIALANEGRTLINAGTLDGFSQLLPDIYSMPASNFNDITSGNTGYPATPGYDLATGLGTPKAQLVIASLVGNAAPTAPAITTQPVNAAVTAGTTATFTAAASGSPAPTAQWQISTDNGATFTNIVGATSASYTTSATVAADSGKEFRAIFSNGVGSPATTNAVTLTVNSPPLVTTQPVNQTVTIGQSVTFTAAATSSNGPVTVQWQFSVNGAFFISIGGATSLTYTYTPAATDSGRYFRALFTNSVGSTPSSAARLAVTSPVTVAGITVGDGTTERSEVRSIAVTFSGPVTFANGVANAAAAFQLAHVQTGNNVVLGAVVTTDSQGRTVVTLSFSGDETDAVSIQNGGVASLADGRYTLTITGASITDANGAAIDAAGAGTLGSNYVSPPDTQGGGAGQVQLYRLFGDTNGDGIVDQVDLGQFRGAFNVSTGNAAYLAFLDADNTGTVDQVDLGQFRARFNGNVF